PAATTESSPVAASPTTSKPTVALTTSRAAPRKAFWSSQINTCTDMPPELSPRWPARQGGLHHVNWWGQPYPLAVPIRVVLADDNFIVREGMRELLETVDEVQVVATCSDFNSLQAAVERDRPDVVVTDIRMPPTNTDEGIRIAEGLRASAPSIGVVELTPREREVLAADAEGKNNASIAQALHLSEGAVEKHISSIFSKLGLSEEQDVHRRVKAALIYLAEEREPDRW